MGLMNRCVSNYTCLGSAKILEHLCPAIVRSRVYSCLSLAVWVLRKAPLCTTGLITYKVYTEMKQWSLSLLKIDLSF